jgi:hypothetical protein
VRDWRSNSLFLLTQQIIASGLKQQKQANPFSSFLIYLKIQNNYKAANQLVITK